MSYLISDSDPDPDPRGEEQQEQEETQEEEEESVMTMTEEESGGDEIEEGGPFRSITHAKKRAFLVAYCETGTVIDAARAAGCSRDSHYHWLKTDDEYAEAYADAEQIATEVLERVAYKRATDGLPEEVWYKGEKTGERKARSDLLLMFLLKARRPEKYRERYEAQISGPGGGSLEVSFRDPDEE